MKTPGSPIAYWVSERIIDIFANSQKLGEITNPRKRLVTGNNEYFTKNELLKHKSDSKIETTFDNYCNYWKEKFYKLHSNEEELNRLFIDIYELQDELTPHVELKDIV